MEDNARVESVQRRSVAVCLGRLRITYSQRELLFDRSSARPSASMHARTHAHAHTRLLSRSLARSHLCLLLRARTRPCTRACTHTQREREREARSPQVVRGKEGVNTRLHTFAMPRCSPVALNEPHCAERAKNLARIVALIPSRVLSFRFEARDRPRKLSSQSLRNWISNINFNFICYNFV